MRPALEMLIFINAPVCLDRGRYSKLGGYPTTAKDGLKTYLGEKCFTLEKHIGFSTNSQFEQTAAFRLQTTNLFRSGEMRASCVRGTTCLLYSRACEGLSRFRENLSLRFFFPGRISLHAIKEV